MVRWPEGHLLRLIRQKSTNFWLCWSVSTSGESFEGIPLGTHIGQAAEGFGVPVEDLEGHEFKVSEPDLDAIRRAFAEGRVPELSSDLPKCSGVLFPPGQGPTTEEVVPYFQGRADLGQKPTVFSLLVLTYFEEAHACLSRGHGHHFACIALTDSIVEYAMYWELKRKGREVTGHWDAVIRQFMEEFPQMADHEPRLQRLHYLYRNPFIHGVIDAVSEVNVRFEDGQSVTPTGIRRSEVIIAQRDREFRFPNTEVWIGPPGQTEEIFRKEGALVGSAVHVAEECFEIARQFLEDVALRIDHSDYKPLKA